MDKLILWAVIFAGGAAVGGLATHQIDRAAILIAEGERDRVIAAGKQADDQASIVLGQEMIKAQQAEERQRQTITELEKSRAQYTITAASLAGELNHYRVLTDNHQQDCGGALPSNPSPELLAYRQATAEFSERLDRFIKDKAAAADAIDADLRVATEWAKSLQPQVSEPTD